MKFIIAIATVLSLSGTTTQAIYLACCEATLGSECPPQYNTTNTYIRNEETYTACCYPEVSSEEQAALLASAPDGDLHECFYPIMTDGGVEAAVFALPKLETAPNETEAVVDVELIMIANEEQGTETAEDVTASETGEANCCSLYTAVQPALRSSTKTSACPVKWRSIDGLFVTSTSADGTEMKMQVCCEAETLAENVDVYNIISCSADTGHVDGKSESTTGEDGSNTANAIVEESDDSSGGSAFGSTAIGVALLIGAIQSFL